jgi:hypothetical protein
VTAAGPWDLVLLSDLVYDPDGLQPLVDSISMLLGSASTTQGMTKAAGDAVKRGSDAAAEDSAGAAAGANGGDDGLQRSAEDFSSLSVVGEASLGPTVLLAVELRADTGVAQFVRLLVKRHYLVEQVMGSTFLLGTPASWLLL